MTAAETIFGTPAWSGVGADHWDGVARTGDRRLLSASSVVKVMAAPALERWMIETTAEVTVDNLSELVSVYNTQGRDAAVRWVDQARWKPKAGAALGAAATGTLVHEFIECWGQGIAPSAESQRIAMSDPVIVAMLDRAWDWFGRYTPRFIRAEFCVFDPANGLAGRSDQEWEVDGLGVVNVDIKTTRDPVTKAGNKKRPYPDQHALQLATYRHAPLMATFEPRVSGKAEGGEGPRFYLLNDAEEQACVPRPPVDASAILHITPAACGLWPVDTAEIHGYVQAAAALHEWLYRRSKSTIRGVWGEEATA